MLAERPTILAVETSGYAGSIALLKGDEVVEQQSLAAEGRRNAQTLVLEVDTLLKRHGNMPIQVDAVAVSIGPGSFTGLRVGLVFAKTFSWVNEAKLIIVDTLQAIAEPLVEAAREVTVISDAQRNEVFVNSYRQSANDVPEPLNTVRVQTLSELQADQRETERLLTGPALNKHREALSSHATLGDESYWQPTASSVAKIAVRKYQSEEFANAYTVEPVYIRRSYAEEKLVASETNEPT